MDKNITDTDRVHRKTENDLLAHLLLVEEIGNIRNHGSKRKNPRVQKRGELRRSVLRIKMLIAQNFNYILFTILRTSLAIKMRVFPNFDSLLTQFVFDLPFTAAALFQREIHEG